MLTSYNGIAFGSKSGALFFDISANSNAVVPARDAVETSEPAKDFKIFEWAPWGANNLHPLTLKRMIDDCGELQSIIRGKAIFTVNRGVLPVQGKYNGNGEYEIEKVIQDDDIDEFLEGSDMYETLYSLVKDNYGYGNFCGRFMLNAARNAIARIRRDDITEMRYKRLNEKNISDGIFLCSEWDRVGATADKNVIAFRLLNMRNISDDLKDIIDNTKLVEIAFTGRESDWGTKYYSDPDWYAARNWVNINIGVPTMKAAMYENNMRPKYIVKIYHEFWDKFVYIDTETGEPKDYDYASKKQLRDTFLTNVDTYLAGSENAYKSIFTEFFLDTTGNSPQKVQYIEIEPVEDKSIDGELLKDSSTSGSMIAFSMGWNPAINGGNLPSGPYTNSQGGSNVRESTLLQIMVAEPERQRMLRILNIVSRFNGWNTKYPGFKWVISSTIPTTLDTGGSSKPAVEGVPGAK